jgi:hypothetical protein
MNPTQTPKTPDISSVSQNTENVDHTRRKIASAGLGGSAVLITLASRPVLGATCLTPSAAGSGNHSQHNPIACAPLTISDWISAAPKKLQGNTEVVDPDTIWTGTDYTPGTLFHPLFTATIGFEYMGGDGLNGQSRTLYDVLTQGNGLNQSTDPSDVGKYFVMGLLNASAGHYGGVIQAIGPDPSVRGIQDEYATKGFFQATAGTGPTKQWTAAMIKAYLSDPGSIF